VRVYVPATLRIASELLNAKRLTPGIGFAVTPTLREWYAEGDLEELEYAALTEAARASLRLLDEDAATPRRRVVLAADLPDADVVWAPDLDRAAVRLGGAVPLSAVAAVHVDDPSAAETVAAAAEAVIAADLGSEDSQFLVDEAEGHELLWYATQELPDLLG
jgi:hypothetical protein